MSSIRTCNYWVSAVSAALGAVITVNSCRYGIAMTMYGPGPGFWPFLLGVGLLLIAALLVIDTIRHRELFASQQVVLTAPENLGAYRMMVLVTAYAVLVFVIGFYLATLIFMPVAMRELGAGSVKVRLAVTLCFLAFIYLVFSTALHISLPLPFFMD